MVRALRDNLFDGIWPERFVVQFLHWSDHCDVLDVEPHPVSTLYSGASLKLASWNLAMSSAARDRAEQALSVALFILEVNSFRVSRCDSLNGSMWSLGCCPVSSMKGEECIDVWTQSL